MLYCPYLQLPEYLPEEDIDERASGDRVSDTWLNEVDMFISSTCVLLFFRRWREVVQWARVEVGLVQSAASSANLSTGDTSPMTTS